MRCSLSILIAVFLSIQVYSQTVINKGDLKYVITTGVPFLRITTDARAAGMGEVGVSTSADNNSGFHNAAKLAFVEGDFGVGANFAPWLSQITKDIYIAQTNGFYKVAEDHTVGLGFKYFTLGKINYTDIQGNAIGEGNPFELALEGNYAFRLAKQFSIGASGRFIYSNLSSGIQSSTDIPPGVAFAVDLSAYYSNAIEIGNLQAARINFGGNLSNMGTKIQYGLGVPDYIPANLTLGGTFEADFDDHNSLAGSLQFSKLLVPTPIYKNNNLDSGFVLNPQTGVPIYKEYSSIAGILKSFGDHPDGISGTLSQFITQIGVEYSYDKKYFLRSGLYYEAIANGGRQFATMGVGFKYEQLMLNFSYLLPITQQKSPLDNQMRISVAYNLGKDKSRFTDKYY